MAASNVEGFNVSVPSKIVEAYSKDVYMKKLGQQLQILNVHIQKLTKP